MPIYEYICEDCQTHFEKIVLNKTQEIACPKCAGKKNTLQLSVFSAANGTSNGASAKSSGGWRRQLLRRRMQLPLSLHRPTVPRTAACLSAHYEHTIVITRGAPVLLTAA